jgi:hypothetical protein
MSLQHPGTAGVFQARRPSQRLALVTPARANTRSAGGATERCEGDPGEAAIVVALALW